MIQCGWKSSSSEQNSPCPDQCWCISRSAYLGVLNLWLTACSQGSSAPVWLWWLRYCRVTPLVIHLLVQGVMPVPSVPWWEWAYCGHPTSMRWAWHFWARLDLVHLCSFSCTLQPFLYLRTFPASFSVRIMRALVSSASSPGNSLNTVIKIAIWEEDQADCKCFSCYFSPLIPYIALPRKWNWDSNSS